MASFSLFDLAQALNAGAGAINAFRQQRALGDLGAKIQTGDWKGAAQTALGAGDIGTALKLMDLGATAEGDKSARLLAGLDGGTAPQSQAPLAAPAAQPVNIPANDEVSRYIADAARQRGIDPAVALRVYASEGRSGYAGDQGSSFGPFQLHYGGVAPGGNRVAGLGDEFTKATGLDARDPSTWKQQVDFALEQAAKGGWGPFHGAAKVGIGERQGIGVAPVQVADASGAVPQSAAPPSADYETRLNNLTRALAVARSPQAKAAIQAQIENTRNALSRTDKQENLAVQRENLRENRLMRQQQFEAAQQEREMRRQEREAAAAAAAEKTTGEQANAATFATRMMEADKIISDPSVFEAGLGVAGGVREMVKDIPGVGNALAGAGNQGPKFQQYDQAKRDFINAVLRKESGAAIGASEFRNAERQYFPVPGDSPEVIAQKAKNRATAIDTIAQGGSPSFRKEFSEKRSGRGGATPKTNGGASTSLPPGWSVQVH